MVLNIMWMSADDNFQFIKEVDVVRCVKNYIAEKKGDYDELGEKNEYRKKFYELRRAILDSKFKDLKSMSILYQINDNMDVCVKFIESSDVGA